MLNIKYHTFNLASAPQGTPTNPSLFFATLATAKKEKKRVYTAFLDLLAVYDSVPSKRETLEALAKNKEFAIFKRYH